MKRGIWIVVLALILAGSAHAQQGRMITSRDSVYLTWDSTHVSTFSYRVANIKIIADGLGGSDTVFIALNNDTTETRMWYMIDEEVLDLTVFSGFIRRKATDTVAVRMLIY